MRPSHVAQDFILPYRRFEIGGCDDSPRDSRRCWPYRRPRASRRSFRSGAVVDAMRGDGGLGFIGVERRESAFDGARDTVFGGFLGADHDLEDVVCVVGRDSERFAVLNTIDQVAQAISPWPVGPGFLEELPAAGAVLPEFIAVGIPIVAVQIERAFRSEQFQAGSAILLDGKAGEHGRITGIAEVQEELNVILRFDADLPAIDAAFGNGHAGHGGDMSDRPQPAGQCGEIVDTQIEKGAAPGAIKPVGPVRSGPAVTATRGDHPAKVAGTESAVDGAEGRTQHGERCAEQQFSGASGLGDQGGAFNEAGGERFFEEHMFARVECRGSHGSMIAHRRQQNDGIDVRRVEQFGVIRVEAGDLVEGGFGAMSFGATQSEQVSAALALQGIGHGEVGIEDVAASGDGEPQG